MLELKSGKKSPASSNKIWAGDNFTTKFHSFISCSCGVSLQNALKIIGNAAIPMIIRKPCSGKITSGSLFMSSSGSDESLVGIFISRENNCSFTYYVSAGIDESLHGTYILLTIS